MYLSNAVLGDFIAKALFGKKWEDMKKFVIPRKGNFVNPQQLSKTDTYAIYYIENKKKRLVNSSDTEYKTENAFSGSFSLSGQAIVSFPRDTLRSTPFTNPFNVAKPLFPASFTASLQTAESGTRSI